MSNRLSGGDRDAVLRIVEGLLSARLSAQGLLCALTETYADARDQQQSRGIPLLPGQMEEMIAVVRRLEEQLRDTALSVPLAASRGLAAERGGGGDGG